MLMAEIRDANGKVLGMLVLEPKDFKTGSKGYFGQGKIPGPFEAERLQVQVQAVIIGSKAAAKATPAKAAASTPADSEAVEAKAG
jgi:hypothetical protein